MTTHSIRPSDPRLDRDRVLATDADMHELFEALLHQACRRQLWLFALDDEHRVAGPLIAMDDYPASPDDLVDAADLGVVSFPHVFIDRVAMVCEGVGASAFALVWERPGDDRFTPVDRAWARALAHEAAEHGPRLRAQFVLHDSGLRQLTPDDYA